MLKDLVKKTQVILDLKREIVGIRFLFIREEYEDLEADSEVKGSFCALVNQALQGRHIKARIDNFTCQGAPELFGMKEVPNFVRSGNQFSRFGLYEDLAVSRSVQNDMEFINQKIYGVEVAPLREMETADMVLMITDAYQAMRIMQAYTYHYGTAKNIQMIGNQGICADLVARPFIHDDINISVLCLGARLNTHAADGELGVGMPVRMFREVVRGLVNTCTSALEESRKEKLQKRLEEAGIEDVPLEFGKVYMSYRSSMKYPESLYND